MGSIGKMVGKLGRKSPAASGRSILQTGLGGLSDKRQKGRDPLPGGAGAAPENNPTKLTRR